MRSDFSSSSLVRRLGEWAPVDMDGAGMDFAERLGLWLNAFDAIGLQAAHQSIRAIRTAAPGPAADTRPAWTQTLDEDVRQVRTALAQAIAQDVLPPAGDSAAEPAYAPYHQRHLELQRQMDQAIGPLRDRVRQALGRASPTLRQLAALDAVLEQMLAPREQQLLPTAAALLERRFGQLRLAATEDWPEVFGQDWRQALLAELELRLEPVAGLLEALGNDLKNRE